MKRFIYFYILLVLTLSAGCNYTTSNYDSSGYSINTVSNTQFIGDTHFLKIHDNSAYILNSTSGMTELSIQNPQNPQIEKNYEMNAFALETWNNGIIMINGNVNIIKINNFGEYNLLETLQYGSIIDCAISNNFLFVADSDYGLRIIDLEFESAIFEISDYYTGFGAKKIIFHDDKIYLMHQGGIKIIDVSNPYYPVSGGDIYFESILDFVLDNNFIYCLDDLNLRIFNLQNNYIEESTTLVVENPKCMTISNNLLFIGTNNYEIVIYNVANHQNPIYEFSWFTNAEVNDIEVIQNYIFVANGSNGFTIQSWSYSDY